MIATTFIVLIGLALLVEIVVTHQHLRAAVERPSQPAPRLPAYPSVTIVRPVRGRDVDAEANFTAALDTGYPGEVETLFLFDDAGDPGYPVACRVVEAHRASGRPGRAAVKVVGAPPAGVTGKLNAMMAGERLAQGELIAFGDSDTRPDRQVLRALVDALEPRPDVGCTFAPVVVDGAPLRAGDVGYAMLINAWYGPSVALTARSGEVPFIMGQLMVFRREALDAIGGVGCARGQLVDDMHIGACVARAGYKNVMIRHPLKIATGGMSVAGFVKLFRRWLLFSRNGLPPSFTWPMWLRGVEFWVGALALAFAIATGHFFAALIPAAGLVAFGASLISLGRRFGGAEVPWRWAWLPYLIPIAAPMISAASMVHREVDWRGRAYALDTQARLA
jgi:ceramide glucosyltransferase